jgi:hypothetical protein
MRSTSRTDWNAHHADELAFHLVARESDARGDLLGELGDTHVGLVPAVRRDHPAVGFGGGVDDRKDRFVILIAAGTNEWGRHGGIAARLPRPRIERNCRRFADLR